eukprot:TRINITY_DN3466_c0_g2_i1.p1 TRINITY_DN3466_c0_g2~~TRINITY_DN3466_c0_g2_i1.p1  ORF type:complete len:380 (-),score=108.39 TRINITY_DN3466_c0_g2_i1:34-1173(-)
MTEFKSIGPKLRSRNENEPTRDEISSILKKKKAKKANVFSSFSTGNSLTDVTLWISASIAILYFLLPSSLNPFEPFLFISHKHGIDEKGEDIYGKGWKDLLFVGYYILVFTWVRDVVMRVFLRKFGIYVSGIIYENKLKRFEEQGYSFLYYLTSSAFGLYCMSRLPTWYFNSMEFWITYPHEYLDTTFKSYYLLQLAFWVQQAIVLALGLEAARKDFLELIIHHIVTILLIVSSYMTNWTRIGNAVFLTMDISDIFLALSKLLNYGPRTKKLSEPVFAFFIFVWIYTRHYLFNAKILYSLYSDFFIIEPHKFGSMDRLTTWYFFGVLLIMLQILCIFWFFLILRILFNLVKTGGKKSSDEREDDEDQGDVVEEMRDKNK